LTVDLLARAVRGLEWVAAEEIATTLPARRLTLARREIRFHLAEPDPGLLRLSTVDDVFVQVGTIGDVGRTREALPALARHVATLDFGTALDAVAALRELPGRPRFDVVASVNGRRKFNRYEVEDEVGPTLASRLRGRYLSRSDGGSAAAAALTMRLLLEGSQAMVAVRLADHPLHRRDWKQHTARGTLHPPVAAALVRLAAPSTGETAADPFCGDGTIAVELALAHPGVRVKASDVEPVRVRNAGANAALAGVGVDLRVADAGRLPWEEASVDVVVTNPPWNLAVDAGGSLSDTLEPFWRGGAALLSPRGRIALIADAGVALARQLHPGGFRELLSQQVRLAGRVSTVGLYAPPGSAATLPARLADWRRRARQAGVVTAGGF
jgi:tRNA (guanine6-N2)-methyltransferase